MKRGSVVLDGRLDAVWALLGSEDVEAAESGATALLDDPAAGAGARRILARIAAHGGDPARAEALLREARDLAPEDPDVHYDLGQSLLAAAKPEEAARCFRATLARRPASPRALVSLANVDLALGRLEAAVDGYAEASHYLSGVGEPHNNRGIALMQLGRVEEGAAAFRDAVRAEPTELRFHQNALRSFQEKGDIAGALAFYRDLAKNAPDVAQVHFFLARVAHAAGRRLEARRAAHRAIALDPAHVDARLLAAQYDLLEERFAEALVHLRRAATEAPEAPKVLYLLGSALAGFRDAESPEGPLRRALELEPDFVPASTALAAHLFDAGKPDEALSVLEAAREQSPENPSVVMGLARVQERLSHDAEATATLEPFLEIDPPPAGVALAAGLLAKDRPSRERAADLLERALRNASTRGVQRAIHFSLGSLYDRLGEYGEAFAHYRVGNDLKETHFDARLSAEIFERHARSHPAASWPELARATGGRKRPIFIVGMPRSGTTLAESVLDRHPDVFGAGELSTMRYISEWLPQWAGLPVPYPEIAPSLTREVLDRAANAYLADIASLDATAAHVVDKMPHNFLLVPLIARIFPDARIVHCTRDWRDNCLSLYFQDFAALHPYAYDLGDLVRYHRWYRDLMAHWRALGIEMFELPYEEMVADQEGTVRRLLSFLGLPWDDRCLDFHRSERVVMTASHQQVREPLYRRSVARWQHYAPFVGSAFEE